MTFDELMEYLTDDNRPAPDSEKEEQATALILETLNVGADVLNKLPEERIAGLMALVQSATFTGAMCNDDYATAALTQTAAFTDALILVVRATAGILTMEEVR